MDQIFKGPLRNQGREDRVRCLERAQLAQGRAALSNWRLQHGDLMMALGSVLVILLPVVSGCFVWTQYESMALAGVQLLRLYYKRQLSPSLLFPLSPPSLLHISFPLEYAICYPVSIILKTHGMSKCSLLPMVWQVSLEMGSPFPVHLQIREAPATVWRLPREGVYPLSPHFQIPGP